MSLGVNLSKQHSCTPTGSLSHPPPVSPKRAANTHKTPTPSTSTQSIKTAMTTNEIQPLHTQVGKRLDALEQGLQQLAETAASGGGGGGGLMMMMGGGGMMVGGGGGGGGFWGGAPTMTVGVLMDLAGWWARP